VLYSTSEGDFSYELPELEHGVYTLQLLKALKGLADLPPHGNEDVYVSKIRLLNLLSLNI
jgi:uncharacterized caspase-like protein